MLGFQQVTVESRLARKQLADCAGRANHRRAPGASLSLGSAPADVPADSRKEAFD